jgi:superfamily II DNA or RNA helicase
MVQQSNADDGTSSKKAAEPARKRAISGRNGRSRGRQRNAPHAAAAATESVVAGASVTNSVDDDATRGADPTAESSRIAESSPTAAATIVCTAPASALDSAPVGRAEAPAASADPAEDSASAGPAAGAATAPVPAIRAIEPQAVPHTPDGDADGADGAEDTAADDETPPREGTAAIVIPPGPLAQHTSRLSDRAIQRLVGGNAFLRGRLYARRGAIADLRADERTAGARVRGRTDEPYDVEVRLSEDGALVSNCTCLAWKGPTGHCKHVAALLVALRDRTRPARPKDQPIEAPPPAPAPTPESDTDTHGPVVIAAPGVVLTGALGGAQTVSVGGKRRRSRRRRRGVVESAAPLAAASHAPLVIEPRPVVPPDAGLLRFPVGPAADRGGLDAWLAPEESSVRPLDLEYRLVVRAASIAVTPVLAGTRQAVPIEPALSGFNTVAAPDRGILRALARHVSRGAPATAELRGEDAAELLSMLRLRRVLLEPASMELRFAEDPLRPRLELDLASGPMHDGKGGPGVRLRVVFEAKGSRRFSLATGAWFEGTPGWHIDTTEGVARPIADVVTPGWLQRLFRSPALVHSIHDLPRLLTDFVPRVAAALGTELPDIAAVADIVDSAPRFVLRTRGDIVEARARLDVLYGDQRFEVPVRGFPSPLAFLPPADRFGRPRVVRRDVGAEMMGVQALLDLGFEVEPDGGELVARGDAAIAFWTEGVARLPGEWEKLIPSDLADVRIRSGAVVPRMRVSSGVDWLSLDVSFDADGVAVDEDELRMCLEKGRRLVKLADGTYAPVQREQVGEVLSRMAEIVASAGSRKKVPLSQAGRVQDLLRLVGDATVTAPTLELFGKLEDIAKVEPVPKPRQLKATLREYQKEGFSWLVFLHNANTGGILADDMGLGKTLQTIALLCWVKAKEKGGPHLVVAPTSVVPNWQREIEKFAPHLEVVVWQGADRHEQAQRAGEADVMITSYALLRRDEEFLTSLDFDYVILDEAQHIKNPLSATARAAKRLRARHRLALTGTPIENRLSEFWSIFDFVSPNMLGSLKTFEETYGRPIERGDLEAAQKLGAAVRPFVKRRTKKEVEKDLPSKIEQEMVVPLADEQAKLYKQIMKEVRESVLSQVEEKGVQKAQIQILAALTRLRQVACDPRLLKLPGNFDQDESGKLAALRELVSEATSGGHRVLVFSQFVEMLKYIREAFDADGVVYEYLDGSTPAEERQRRVDRFNHDPAVQVFLISLKAGGTGLNLTSADTVIHFDPWWNPAVEDQATDRAHRIGQTKIVTVYRLIAKGTVEEKILKLGEKKRALVENVLSTEGAGLKGLTKADVDDLFSDA